MGGLTKRKQPDRSTQVTSQGTFISTPRFREWNSIDE